MSLAIRIDRLGKRYRVNHAVERVEYQTLRETLSRAALAPWRRLRGTRSSEWEDFWALRDVSFDVEHGESVGIIGRNGAGKSTLLKILSQITKPTTGRAHLYGRVASLLEVGTGFHPELTGRENVFLNGSILGMSHREIHRKFDEIVDFSGVERFLDTPVKRYSSGMKVRLAFSIAAHLEPEILVIDEVLAVGDAEFQQKCLGKMGDVATSGRTVLFVSHNMGAIESLCCRCAVISHGGLAFLGSTRAAIDHYRRSFATAERVSLRHRTDRRGTGAARLVSATILDADGLPTDHLPMGEPLRIVLECSATAPVGYINLGLALHADTGQRLLRLNTADMAYRVPGFNKSQAILCETDPLCLLPGRYYLSASVVDQHTVLDAIDEAITVTISESNALGTGRLPRGPGDLLFTRSAWRVVESH